MRVVNYFLLTALLGQEYGDSVQVDGFDIDYGVRMADDLVFGIN